MNAGLKAVAASLVLALAAACGGETAPGGPKINTNPPVPDDEDQLSADIPLTLQEALADFGDCMDLEIWMRTGLYDLPYVETDQNIECQACHADKSGGSLLSDDLVATFDYHTQLPAVMRLVTGTVDQRGNFKDLVPSNRYIEKGVDSCLEEEGIVCHPSYTLPINMQEAVAGFVNETLDRWKNNTCNAPYTPPQN